jgi:type III pantothenate kinase
MILLLDIGNSNTHLGLAGGSRVVRHRNIPTSAWFSDGEKQIRAFIDAARLERACFCSVVPQASPECAKLLRRLRVEFLELNSKTLRGVGIDYPQPQKIGSDRLANALAVKHHFGAPSIVVDFGTAVTFDVVDRKGNYVGGIIAPGLAALTDYLHEKTALLPKIKIRDTKAVIGKNTEQAMLIGAVHGYRGLIRELLSELKAELKSQRLPVVATGGYAELIAATLPEITAVDPLLTLEGLRLLVRK